MCDRRISTENGVLTCDLPAGHDGFHHAVHAGGTVVAIDRHKSVSPTPFTDAEGNYLAVHEVAPIEIEWPQRKAAFERWLDPANFDAQGRQRRNLASGIEPARG